MTVKVTLVGRRRLLGHPPPREPGREVAVDKEDSGGFDGEREGVMQEVVPQPRDTVRPNRDPEFTELSTMATTKPTTTRKQ